RDRQNKVRPRPVTSARTSEAPRGNERTRLRSTNDISMPESLQRIALIAHDGTKADMLAVAIQNKEVISKFEVVATGTTGKLIKEKAGLRIARYLSGPRGGDGQIAARVGLGEVEAVVFLVDPLDKHPHDPDIQTL